MIIDITVARLAILVLELSTSTAYFKMYCGIVYSMLYYLLALQSFLAVCDSPFIFLLDFCTLPFTLLSPALKNTRDLALQPHRPKVPPIRRG